jgi:hypothetical protein
MQGTAGEATMRSKRSRERGSRVRRLALVALAAGCLATGPAAAAKPQPPRTDAAPLRVLFVGNSYTYVNDVPGLVARVAAARGVELVPGMVAEPNFAIEDHLARRDYAEALARGWDWVVLQQGPSSLPENQELLRLHAGRAAALARERGIKVALFAAWPALDNAHTWPAAELSYRNAAHANGLCVLPVSTAWRLARERAPDVQLYASDRLHAGLEGSLLAALVLAQGLLPRPHYTDPPDLTPLLPVREWGPILGRVGRLDPLAREALQLEPERCVLTKHGGDAGPR